MTAPDVRQVLREQMESGGARLLLAMEPVDDGEFFAENPNGFSAAWVMGHLACVADLWSSWFSGTLLLDREFHSVFNETDVVEDGPLSKAASVDKGLYPKATLLFRFREAMMKAFDVLDAFELSKWDARGPSGLPVYMSTGGAVWRYLAVHVDWHCGELAASMKRFHHTYALNIASHYFYKKREESA